jgi:hypothetical protein
MPPARQQRCHPRPPRAFRPLPAPRFHWLLKKIRASGCLHAQFPTNALRRRNPDMLPPLIPL